MAPTETPCAASSAEHGASGPVRIHEVAAPKYVERGRCCGQCAVERAAAHLGSAEARMAAIWGRVRGCPTGPLRQFF